MSYWASQFRIDPIPALLSSGNPALRFFVQRDLEGNTDVWISLGDLPEVLAILKKQQQDGSWKAGMKYQIPYPQAGLLGTWRSLRFLIGQYDLKKDNPAIRKASEFVFSCQSAEGDFRGILANQYAPYYTGALLSLLIMAGYRNDKRVTAGIRWLLDMRQDDGGWVIGSPGMVHRASKEIN